MQRRTRLIFITLAGLWWLAVGGRSAFARSAGPLFWNECDDYCPAAACNDECFVDGIAFENGNSTNCLDYGVFDPNQFCCGDQTCNAAAGEDDNSCPADCTTPPPPPPSITLLINGSFNDGEPTWAQRGSDEFEAVSSTYGVDPQPYFWSENGIGDIDPASGYPGIFQGAQDLAVAVSNLPAGDVNLVAHSHGGNVSILATYAMSRQVKHFIELGTPVNWDLPRDLGGQGAAWRCTASSESDDVQFLGASPFQVGAYIFNTYWASYYFALAYQDYENDDEADYWNDEDTAEDFAFEAQYFWDSTKDESGETDWFDGLDHSSMHEPGVWYALNWWCKTGG